MTDQSKNFETLQLHAGYVVSLILPTTALWRGTSPLLSRADHDYLTRGED